MLFERFKCFRSYFVPFFPSLYGYVEGHMTLKDFLELTLGVKSANEHAYTHVHARRCVYLCERLCDSVYMCVFECVYSCLCVCCVPV